MDSLVISKYIPLNHVTIVSFVCQIPLRKLLRVYFFHAYFTVYLNVAPYNIAKYGLSSDKVAVGKVSHGSPSIVFYPFHRLFPYVNIMISKFSWSVDMIMGTMNSRVTWILLEV